MALESNHSKLIWRSVIKVERHTEDTYSFMNPHPAIFSWWGWKYCYNFDIQWSSTGAYFGSFSQCLLSDRITISYDDLWTNKRWLLFTISVDYWYGKKQLGAFASIILNYKSKAQFLSRELFCFSSSWFIIINVCSGNSWKTLVSKID